MLKLKTIKDISEHYSKMFGTPTNVAGAIMENNLDSPNTLIYVGMPSADKPYYKLGTIGMSEFRQSKTKTPYTEIVMTLPSYWKFNTGMDKWDWPILMLKTAAKSPYLAHKTLDCYSSFALNDSFEPFDKSTDKCAAVLTPLKQFDKSYSTLKTGFKKIHFLQLLATNKFTFDALDKKNRKQLVDKLVNSNFDFTVC